MKNSTTCTTGDDTTPPLSHPLELIPFFRRWPPSIARNLLYTVIWSSAMGLAFAVLEVMVLRGEALAVISIWPLLLMSNLIGAMIHAGSVLSNRYLHGWPRRARGLPRVLFSMALVGISVPLGIALGNLIWRGTDPVKLLTNRSIVGESVLIGIAVAVLLYLVRSSAERRHERELAEATQAALIASTDRMLAEAKLRALQAQIEPHFLYNTLANVLSLIATQPVQAQYMLERFIDYLRASLAASRSEEATLASETKLIAAYLDVLAVRMGDRLRYRIDLPDALRQFNIAPMLLQPVVENAIAHGLEPKVEGGEIVVSAALEGEQLCIRISDTGVGLNLEAPRKPGGGVGLSNLRERLRSLYGAAAKVELLENQPCGMTVRLMLPLNASPTSTPSAP
ncbi:sensor histidine kinase [Pseudoduganella sp. FT55W]|uniref:Sensor histidine kinase n=1 Tax=Duganella rivi TaxID=2666083 RepID=A0A7X4GPC9_9BURK|nr:histidine kinase [Duganella rivi]MYM67212.1 sensor histidine kinase [Duganella rivi]